MNSFSKTVVNQRLDSFFDLTSEVLGDRFQEILDELKIKELSKASRLSLHSLISVLNTLNVTLDSVVNQTVDMETLREQAFFKDGLPQRFLNMLPYSSRFTGYYMLDYIEKKFGQRSASFTRQHLQLKEAHFQDVTQKNNLLLPMSITNYVLDYHGKGHVEAMGMNSMNLYRSTAGGILLSQMSSVFEMLERFFIEFAPVTVEKNYHWRVLKKDNDSIYLSGKPKEEVLEAFGTEMKSSCSLEVLRNGFFAALPSLIEGVQGQCHQMKGLSRGDDEDLYEISFHKDPHPKQSLLH